MLVNRVRYSLSVRINITQDNCDECRAGLFDINIDIVVVDEVLAGRSD